MKDHADRRRETRGDAASAGSGTGTKRGMDVGRSAATAPLRASAGGFAVSLGLIAALASGCAAMDDAGPVVGPPFEDAGANPEAGGRGPPFCTDCPSDASLGSGPDMRSEGIATGADALAASDVDRASCYDGQDNNLDGVFDCGDPGCARLPSCCVGATSLGCCGAEETVATLGAAGCTGTLAGCTAEAEIVGFGAPLPELLLGAIRPLGDAVGDSGALFVKPLDAGRALVVRGELSTPVGACEAGCYESVGLGLVAGGVPGPTGSVRPVAGVVVSAARAEVALVLAGEIAQRLPLGTVGDVRVVLAVLPTGAVQLDVRNAADDVPLGTLTGRITPGEDALQLAIYGRGTNVSEGGRTSEARDVVVSSSLCDAPSRWLARSELATTATAPSAPSAPTVASGNGQTLLAWEEGGAIALRVLPRRLAPGVALPADGPRLAATGTAYGDPDLHFDLPPGDVAGGYTLYVANRTTGAIDRVRLAPDGTPSMTTERWANPADLGAELLTALDGPSVLRPAEGTSGVTYLFARALMVGGGTRIVRLVLDGDGDPIPPEDWDLATVRTTQPDFGAFDRDEVAAPSAYRHNGSVQVAFAGRSGARWAIGLMATDLSDLSLWRRAPAPTILTGDASGFDALSVRDPAVVTRRAEVEMLYVGSDGARDVLGLATRLATDHLTLRP
jgi:hypothetical protein